MPMDRAPDACCNKVTPRQLPTEKLDAVGSEFAIQANQAHPWTEQAATYLSMQMVRLSSRHGYEKFKTVFSDVSNHLKTLPGFIHLIWWVYPDESTFTTRSVSGPAL